MTLPCLKDADWLQAQETQAVLSALNTGGAETRVVGGAVRNALLRLPVHEADLATTAPPDQITALAEAAGLTAIPTGIAHGTVTVVAGGKSFEVTTLRRDVETFGRHAKVAFTDDWKADAARRDFTMNALYADADGRVFDPLGGEADLQAGIVRFIGDPQMRIKEDYLRILRFFRFQAGYGKGPIDQAGLAACIALRCGIEGLSAERVWSELRRLLVAPRALAVVETLYDYGLLTGILHGVPRLLPFAALAAIERRLGLEADAILRLAALTVFVDEDVARLAARFRLSNAEQAVLRLGAEPLAVADETAAKALLYRLGETAYRRALLLAWAASGASADGESWRGLYALPERWRAPEFPLRGDDIAALGLKGPEIGRVLRTVEQSWIAGGFKCDREGLLDRARAVMAETLG
jgi:poly(A) polymerase